MSVEKAAEERRWWEARQKARNPYRDDRYPERHCDYCGLRYRGPAVHCSLDCAIADA